MLTLHGLSIFLLYRILQALSMQAVKVDVVGLGLVFVYE